MTKIKNAGFTLIEMVVVLTLILVIVGITISMFITGNKVFSDSDVKSSLQIEGQRIQEEISNIAMQGNYIKSVNGDDSTGIISDIIINSYDKSGNPKDFEIKNDSGKFTINDNEITGNLKSIQINKDIIEAKNNEKKLKGYKVIKFEITLAQNKGFSKGIEYPINFIVTFRNAA